MLPPAPQDELEGMIAHFEALLGETFATSIPKSRAVATRLTLRTMLTKPGWNHLEVRTMRGVLSALERERVGATASSEEEGSRSRLAEPSPRRWGWCLRSVSLDPHASTPLSACFTSARALGRERARLAPHFR